MDAVTSDPTAAVLDPDLAVLAVVGERRDDPDRLLFRAADGRYYTYTARGGDLDLIVVELTADWAIDSAA